MEEKFQYFLAADTIGMSPFRWAMTVVFTIYLGFTIYLIWQRGLKDLDILSSMLILIILIKSCYAIFINDESLDQALRLLLFLFPVGTTVLTHFLFTKYKNLRLEQFLIGFLALFLLLVNLVLGGALIPGSAHWWSEFYRLILINQIWLVLSIGYSLAIFFRLSQESNLYKSGQ